MQRALLTRAASRNRRLGDEFAAERPPLVVLRACHEDIVAVRLNVEAGHQAGDRVVRRADHRHLLSVIRCSSIASDLAPGAAAPDNEPASATHEGTST